MLSAFIACESRQARLMLKVTCQRVPMCISLPSFRAISWEIVWLFQLFFYRRVIRDVKKSLPTFLWEERKIGTIKESCFWEVILKWRTCLQGVSLLHVEHHWTASLEMNILCEECFSLKTIIIAALESLWSSSSSCIQHHRHDHLWVNPSLDETIIDIFAVSSSIWPRPQWASSILTQYSWHVKINQFNSIASERTIVFYRGVYFSQYRARQHCWQRAAAWTRSEQYPARLDNHWDQCSVREVQFESSVKLCECVRWRVCRLSPNTPVMEEDWCKVIEF